MIAFIKLLFFDFYKKNETNFIHIIKIKFKVKVLKSISLLFVIMDTIGLKIDLTSIPKRITRQNNYCSPCTERMGDEKYYRHTIYVYNDEGKHVDSGFVQINDLSDMCKMIRVLSKNKIHFHAFDQIANYGSKLFKTGKYEIRDLATGSFIRELFELPNHIPYGNLLKDEQYIYSQMLLECLEEYSLPNEPKHIRDYKKFVENNDDKIICCRLFERLDIDESFTNGEISEEEKNIMLSKLDCICESKLVESELSEHEKILRAELKLKAQTEIAEVFFEKEFSKNIKYKMD